MSSGSQPWAHRHLMLPMVKLAVTAAPFPAAPPASSYNSFRRFNQLLTSAAVILPANTCPRLASAVPRGLITFPGLAKAVAA